MRKSEILKALAAKADLKKSLKADRKDLARLSERVLATEGLLNAVEGVTLFEDHPVRVVHTIEDGGQDVGFTVLSAVEKVGRSATGVAADGEWLVFALADADAEAREVGRYAKVADAEKAAKSFVSTGRRPKVKAA